MHWLKIFTDSIFDGKFRLATEKFGPAGNGFYLIVLLRIAFEFKADQDPSCSLSLKSWCQLLGVSPKRFQELLTFFESLALLESKTDAQETELLCIRAPIVLELLDEYTQKISRKNLSKTKCPDNVRKESELESESESEPEKKKTPSMSKPLTKPGESKKKAAGVGVSKTILPAPDLLAEASGLENLPPLIPPEQILDKKPAPVKLAEVLPPEKATPPPEISRPNPPEKASGPAGQFPADFSVFWSAYPRKEGKKAALKAWKKARDKPCLEELLRILEKSARTEQWRKEGGRFIPHPATWLNQGRWADEVAEQSSLPVLSSSRNNFTETANMEDFFRFNPEMRPKNYAQLRNLDYLARGYRVMVREESERRAKEEGQRHDILQKQAQKLMEGSFSNSG